MPSCERGLYIHISRAGEMYANQKEASLLTKEASLLT